MATKELTLEQQQGVVDEMAKALGVAETGAERLLILIGALPRAVHDFHHTIGTHVSFMGEIHESFAEAAAHAGKALAMLGVGHSLLNEMRIAKALPEPGVEPLNGGGHGKP